jgi:hypothetical protein
MADKQMLVHVTVSATDQASPKIKSAVESLNGLEAALRKAQASSEAFKAKWDATFATAGAVGGKVQVAGAALLGLGGIAVKAASDFGEMSSMAGQVFKSQTEAVTSWADTTGEALNRSSADLLQYAAGFQGLFTPMGIARGEASQMSEAVAQLAVDLGSFWNKQEPDVVRDLQSAFAGETESMRKYGVFLSDAALDQELFNRGIKGGSTAATEAEKAHARMAIIMRATKDAQGDAARTSGSLENQLKGLKAELKENAIAAGQALVPALEELAPIAKEALQDLTAFLQTPAGEAFVKWAAGIALVGVTGGTLVKHLGDIAGGAVQIGSLASSAWDRFGGGAAKAARSAADVAQATEGAATQTNKLGAIVGAITSPLGLATIGIAALGVAIWRLSAAYEESEKWSRDFQTALNDIDTSKPSKALQDWRTELQKASDAAALRGNAAAEDGINSPMSPGMEAAHTDREVVVRAIAELQAREEAARARMEQFSKGSVAYLRAEQEALQAHYDQLAVAYKYRTQPGPKPAALRQAIQQDVNEAGIYAAALDRNRKALDDLTQAQDKTTQLTKAQTKANEDAVKAADGYSDAQDAAAKATADVAEAVETAGKRVNDALQSQTDAWRDAAERVRDAEQAVADATEDATDRVAEAEQRVQDAKNAAAELEVDTAEAIIDANDSLADARERAADAAAEVLKTEKDIADERVKIEEDAAEKIDGIRKSSADKLKSLGEKLQELQAKLRGEGGGAANVFNIGGRMVMLSDKDADRYRERLKLLADIRGVHQDIAKAQADEVGKVEEARRAEKKRLDDWAEKSPERLGKARESASDAAYDLSKAERRTPRQISRAEARLADSQAAVGKAEEALADARRDAARRIADSEKALVKAKEAATKAINDAEQKRLDAEAARAKTFASISEKLEQVAERLGQAWMKLDTSGRGSTIGASGAIAYAANAHQSATTRGRGLMGLTAPDVTRSMAALGALNIGAPTLPGAGAGYRAGGAATVVIGLEPGLVARELQQDPARGVVVQVVRATTAKSPAQSRW